MQDVPLNDIKLGSDIIEREFSVKNLGITFDEVFSWSKHVNLIVAKAYGKLCHAYRFKNLLTPEAKWNLCETYILSQFNYGDIILQGMNTQLIDKIQRIQNSCIRFAFGFRKFDRITNFRISKKIMSMENRRLSHSLTLMFKITKNVAPDYLCDRITFHNNLHNYNTRHRNEIWTPFARMTTRASSFFISTATQLNHLSRVIDFTGLSIPSFKIKCKKYLLDKEVYQAP